jgi:ECF transporter S component (folate family)
MFKNGKMTTKSIVMLALLASLSLILGRLLAFTAGPFRISFENLPVILAGVMFGPIAGLCVGVVEDLVGCLISGYAINPIITVGAGCVGLMSGLAFRYMPVQNKKVRLGIAIAAAHIIASVIIKSIGLYVYYHYSVAVLLWRIPTYAIIGGAEFVILRLLLGNKAFTSQFERMGANEYQ